MVSNWPRQKLGAFLRSDAALVHNEEDDKSNYSKSSNISTCSSPVTSRRFHNNNSAPVSGDSSPNYSLSPWNQSSPYSKSPWIIPSPVAYRLTSNGLIGSIVREEGHVCSLAASGDLLYTGSESKNIRVWKNLKEFTGFQSNSGFVKAIVIHQGKIFTGHQDGKIRVWKISTTNPSEYMKVGTLPTLKDSIIRSVNPNNYVEARRRKNILKIKHFDSISCLSLNSEAGLLYSGSWDKTMKVWRTSDYKCLESVKAHEDAINSVAVGFGTWVFTGSADGTVKAWRRGLKRSGTKHVLVQKLLSQENAVNSLAVNKEAAVVYCGSSDGLVNFWENEKHLSHGGVLRGHKMAVLCLATAGSLVFSGSADKSICVWRREPGGVHVFLSLLTGHNGPVKCLAIEENHDQDQNEGWIVYSGSLDKSVKVRRVTEHAPKWEEYRAPNISISSRRNYNRKIQ